MPEYLPTDILGRTGLTVIVGTLNPEHMRENVGAVLRGPLPPDVYSEAKRSLDGAGVRPRTSTS